MTSSRPYVGPQIIVLEPTDGYFLNLLWTYLL
jgi:hypothetical protein